MKKILLLGASGSIGVQTIDVLENHPEMFELVAFSVGKQIDKARSILNKFNVKEVCISKKEDAELLQKEYPEVHFSYGNEGLDYLASLDNYDLCVNALVGFVGLRPTLCAIEHGKDVALANKETLVVAGELVQKAMDKHHVELFPIDSEHSAIAQCLRGNKYDQVNRLIITASGGSFRDKSREELENVTLEQTLKHPNWAMGAKITIDSATMMNKGFEVIEAHYLFGFDYDHIDVVLHPESIIHSMVEYKDHSVMAQLGNADMRLPIQYALCYPERFEMNTEPLDLVKIGTLHFREMDTKRFPLLRLAYDMGRKGGNMPCVMNAANEEANFAFQRGEVGFMDIERLIFAAIDSCEYEPIESVNDIFKWDTWTREFVRKKIAK